MNELTPTQTIIPLLVPAAIAGLKFFWPRVPKALLPYLAPLLGAGVEIILHLSGSGAASPAVGAILGAVGLWLREAYDQSKKLLTRETL